MDQLRVVSGDLISARQNVEFILLLRACKKRRKWFNGFKQLHKKQMSPNYSVVVF